MPQRNLNRPSLAAGAPRYCFLLHGTLATEYLSGVGFCQLHADRIRAIQADAAKVLRPKARPRRHISFLPQT